MRNLRWQARASARAPRLGYYAGGISLPATNDAFGVTAYLETQAVRAGNETSSRLLNHGIDGRSIFRCGPGLR
jgi:hypothetical protein